MKDNKNEALNYLYDLSQQQGYLTIDNILDASFDYNLSVSATDWLSSELTNRGIILYEEAPSIANTISENDESTYADYSQIDYSEVFKRVIEIDPSLTSFVEEIRNIVPAQYKEITKLTSQMIEGNQHARERMIEIHLRQALRIALRRSELYDYPLSEAVGEACVGLVTAVDKYNPNINGAFGSYANMWMIQTMSREQSTQRIFVYYPAHKKELYFSVYPMLKERGCLSCSEIHNCDKVKILVEEQTKVLDAFDDILLQINAWKSLEGILEDNEDEAIRLLSIANDDKTESYAESIALKDLIDCALSSLTEREQEVIRLRFGFFEEHEYTLEEVGQKLGVTRERIRQIEGKAIKKLGRINISSSLEGYC